MYTTGERRSAALHPVAATWPPVAWARRSPLSAVREGIVTLDMMQRAGLLESRRYGKWTYNRRNEEAIRELGRYISTEL